MTSASTVTSLHYYNFSFSQIQHYCSQFLLLLKLCFLIFCIVYWHMKFSKQNAFFLDTYQSDRRSPIDRSEYSPCSSCMRLKPSPTDASEEIHK